MIRNVMWGTSPSWEGSVLQLAATINHQAHAKTHPPAVCQHDRKFVRLLTKLASSDPTGLGRLVGQEIPACLKASWEESRRRARITVRVPGLGHQAYLIDPYQYTGRLSVFGMHRYMDQQRALSLLQSYRCHTNGYNSE